MKSARWLLALAIGLGVGVVVTWWIMKPPKVRNGVTAVVPGVLYRSGQLDPQDLQKQIEQRGIKTVINLGSTKDWDVAVCQAQRVNYIRIPAGDVWQLEGLPNPEAGNKVFPKPDLSAVWKALGDPAAQPVLIHCWGGTHRTGLFAAQYRIQRQGWTPQDAIDEMKLFGFDTADPKFANVLDYLRHLPQTAAAPASQPVAAGR